MARGKKTGGRKPGVKNKVISSASIREQLTHFVSTKGLPSLLKDFGKLQPKDRQFVLAKILPFTTPTFQSISFKLKDLSEDDLAFVLQKIKEELKDNESQRPFNISDQGPS